MKLELVPDRSLKWHLHWNLTAPPAAPFNLGPGMFSINIFNKQSLLFFLQFTRADGGQTTFVPFVYDMSTRILKVASKSDPNQRQHHLLFLISNFMSGFYERFPHLQTGKEDFVHSHCLLFVSNIFLISFSLQPTVQCLPSFAKS